MMNDYIHTGDQVYIDYSKLFYSGIYLFLICEFGEDNDGPFEVVETDPIINFSKIIIDNRLLFVTNDILKKLTGS